MSLNGYGITVIVPAYNEEKTIQSTIKGLQRIPCIDQILVVNDGSEDHTAGLAAVSGADVLSLAENHGKAYAMKAGFLATQNPILVFIDGDVGESAEEAVKLIVPLCEDQADAVIAQFPMTPGKGGFGLVKGLAKWGMTLFTGKSLSCVLSGQRGFKRSVLQESFFQYKGFGIEFGMTVDLLQQDISVLEATVAMHHRTTGRDLKGFLHRYRQFAAILRVIIEKLARGSIARIKMLYPGG